MDIKKWHIWTTSTEKAVLNVFFNIFQGHFFVFTHAFFFHVYKSDFHWRDFFEILTGTLGFSRIVLDIFSRTFLIFHGATAKFSLNKSFFQVEKKHYPSPLITVINELFRNSSLTSRWSSQKTNQQRFFTFFINCHKFFGREISDPPEYRFYLKKASCSLHTR